MPKLDQFESVFRAAHREPYAYESVELNSILVVTDLDDAGAAQFEKTARAFLSSTVNDAAWTTIGDAAYADLGALIDLVKDQAPDLVISYRNLKSGAWQWPYSLGEYVDVLTQATSPAVLLLPTPHDPESVEPKGTNAVMVVADHLTGDHHLVNVAVSVTEPGGTLHLTHVESVGDFALYLRAFERIPTIDTELAREELMKILLKEPHDYITTCRAVLEEQDIDVAIVETVEMGHRVATYSKLIRDHEIDLLVLDTKHAHQLAMDSLAHRLAVQFRNTPILLL